MSPLTEYLPIMFSSDTRLTAAERVAEAAGSMGAVNAAEAE